MNFEKQIENPNNPNDQFLQLSIQSEKTFNALRAALRYNDDNGHVFFRGQANSEWSLSSSLERIIDSMEYYPKGFMKLVELDPLRKIQKVIKNYNLEFPIPDPHSFDEWLTIIQHYGGATRLLDFTTSFYIGLFFAINDKKRYEKSALWIIDDTYTHNIHDKQFENYENYYNKEFNERFSQFYGPELGIEINPNIKFENEVRALFPKTIPKRMHSQKGVFLYGKNFEFTFEENLYNARIEDLEKIKAKRDIVTINKYTKNDIETLSDNIFSHRVTKVLIPSNLNKMIQFELDRMNITFQSLFPDFNGLMNEFYHKKRWK